MIPCHQDQNFRGSIVDLIANKRVSRRGVFPFRFRGSCRLEPCLDGEVAPEIVQSAGGFDEGVLKARLEVAINVTDATEDLDSGATVLDAHPYLSLRNTTGITTS